MSEHRAAIPLDECDPAEVTSRIRPSRGAPGHVVFVGTGLGGPLRLTLAGLQTIADADVLVLSPELSPDLLGEPEVSCDPDAPVLLAAVDPDLDKVAQLAMAGFSVAWLVAGDPMIDGEAEPLAVGLVDRGCRLDVVPGLPKATLALTASGISDGNRLWWMTRDPELAEVPPNIMALLQADQVAELARQARDRGLPTDMPALVTVNYASSAQRSIETTLGGLAQAAEDCDGRSLAVVVGEAARRDPRLNWYESKPLFGWQVLVPRTKGLPGAIERRLEHHGAIPVQMATISVQPPRNPQPMERAIQGLVDGRFQWVIFNSANSVRAVTERLALLGLDSRAFSGLRIAAVGADTAEALNNWGISPDLVPEGEQRGEALAAEFPAFDDLLDPINRILIPRAEIAVDALVTSVNELGWEVEEVIAHRTVRAAPPPAEIRDAIKGGRFDAVVFSSASTVRNMVGIAGKPHAATVVAAVGPATVASCEEHGLRVDVVPEHPNLVELVDALAEFADARRQDLIASGEPVRRPSQRTRRRK